MQILQCASANAAKLFGGETGARLGNLENGYSADFVILNSNPLDDIAHASDIETVIKNGVAYPADSICIERALQRGALDRTRNPLLARESSRKFSSYGYASN